MKRSAAGLGLLLGVIAVFSAGAWWWSSRASEDDHQGPRPSSESASNAPPMLASSADDPSSQVSSEGTMSTPTIEGRTQAPALAPGFVHLHGKILDGESGLVIGMHVALESDPERSLAVSSSQGDFEIDLPNEPGALVVTDHGWTTIEKIALPVAETPHEGSLVVLPKLELAGIVHEDDGTPLRGARIHLDFDSSRLRRGAPSADVEAITTCSTVSDESGRFVLPDVPWLEHGSLLVELAGYVPHSEPFRPASRSNVDIEMWREHDARLRIDGTVVHMDGSPAGRALVILGGSQSSADDTGSFHLEFARGDSREPLWAVEPGLQGAAIRHLDWTAEEAAKDRRAALLVLGPPARSIRGHVVEADGRPGTGWMVSLASTSVDSEQPQESSPVLRTSIGVGTDREGGFRFEGLSDGAYALLAVNEARLEKVGPIGVRPPADDVVIRVAAAAKSLVVRGRVIGPDREPIAWVGVTLGLVVTRDQSMFAEPDWVLEGGSTTTANDGTFEFVSVPDADVCFQVTPDSLDSVDSVRFDPRDARGARRSLRDGQPIEIVVRRRIRLALIGARGPDGPDEVAAVDGNGRLLPIRVSGGRTLREGERLTVRPVRTIWISVSGDARRLLLYRDGTEVSSKSITVTKQNEIGTIQLD